jgi:hypothetical protein
MPSKQRKSKPKSAEQTHDEGLSPSVLFSPENSDMGFLMWIHERLEHVHGESPNLDYMHKLRAIIADMNPAQATPSRGQGKNGIKQLTQTTIHT